MNTESGGSADEGVVDTARLVPAVFAAIADENRGHTASGLKIPRGTILRRPILSIFQIFQL
jgi:hypothetical protein